MYAANRYPWPVEPGVTPLGLRNGDRVRLPELHTSGTILENDGSTVLVADDATFHNVRVSLADVEPFAEAWWQA
jgi:hypothetical protein